MKRIESKGSLILVPVILLGLGWLSYEFLFSKGGNTAHESTPSVSNPSTAPKEPTPVPEVVKETSTATRSTATEVEEDTVEPDPIPADPSAPGGGIDGLVLSPDGTPVPEADVELMRAPALGVTIPGLRDPTGKVLNSDARGHFEFSAVAPGEDYVVVVSHLQFGNGELGPIKVRPGEVTHVGEVRLATGIKVHGYILAGGRGVEGAVVTLQSTLANAFRKRPSKESPIELRILSSSDGAYLFEAVPINNFMLCVDADGYALATQDCNAFLGAVQDQEISFDLVPAFPISGIVMDDQGRPIAATRVTASLVESTHTFRCENEAMSGADGKFAIQQLAEGSYTLTAEHEGFSNATRHHVAAGSADVEIQMMTQGSVSGVVLDEESMKPVHEFELVVMRAIKGRAPGRTNIRKRFKTSDGTFTLGGLDPNEYVIEARAREYAPCTSDPFAVTRGATTNDIRVLMNRGGTVVGSVVDGNRQPVANAVVSVNPNGFKWTPVLDILNKMGGAQEVPMKLRTGADGKFKIELIVPATYQIAAEHPDYASGEVNDINIVKGVEQDIQELVLIKGACIEGHVFNENGQALPGAAINATSAQQDHKNAVTDPSGFYRMTGLRPGEYNLMIHSYPSKTKENPLVSLVRSKNSSQKVTVRDQDVLTIDLRLTPLK